MLHTAACVTLTLVTIILLDLLYLYIILGNCVTFLCRGKMSKN